MRVSATYSVSFFFSSRRRHTRLTCDWSSDVCSSDLEQDEFLTERVEAPIVEHRDADNVRRVPLVDGDGVQELPVRPVVVAEVRQADERPEQQCREPGGGDREQTKPDGPVHSPPPSSVVSSVCPRTRAIAISRTSG